MGLTLYTYNATLYSTDSGSSFSVEAKGPEDEATITPNIFQSNDITGDY